MLDQTRGTLDFQLAPRNTNKGVIKGSSLLLTHIGLFKRFDKGSKFINPFVKGSSLLLTHIGLFERFDKGSKFINPFESFIYQALLGVQIG